MGNFVRNESKIEGGNLTEMNTEYWVRIVELFGLIWSILTHNISTFHVQICVKLTHKIIKIE